MERPFSEAEVKCLTLQLLKEGTQLTCPTVAMMVMSNEFAQTAHMLKAVECLHAAFVIHRDIKLSNLLLSLRPNVLSQNRLALLNQ